MVTPVRGATRSFLSWEKTGRRSLPLRCLLDVTGRWYSLGATNGVVNGDEERSCFRSPLRHLGNGPLLAPFGIIHRRSSARSHGILPPLPAIPSSSGRC